MEVQNNNINQNTLTLTVVNNALSALTQDKVSKFATQEIEKIYSSAGDSTIAPEGLYESLLTKFEEGVVGKEKSCPLLIKRATSVALLVLLSARGASSSADHDQDIPTALASLGYEVSLMQHACLLDSASWNELVDAHKLFSLLKESIEKLTATQDYTNEDVLLALVPFIAWVDNNEHDSFLGVVKGLSKEHFGPFIPLIHAAASLVKSSKRFKKL